MKVHCFFEQSGTFKKEFIKLGHKAIDYDILNKFGETDIKVNLFNEIEYAYNNKCSIFDYIKENELIIAFFPCIRFTRRMIFNFTRTGAGKKKFKDIEKLEQNIRYFDEMNYLYSIISKLVIICIRQKIKLIIENPYHEDHILSQFWHIKPKVIDMDRTLRGDYYKKPTQYWFINCEPKYNFIMKPLTYKETKKINNSNKIERSLISSEYANRFIEEFIL